MPTGIYQHKKGYKIKDTSKMKEGVKNFFQNGGVSGSKGKHWKVKDTSNMRGRIPGNWKDGLTKLQRKEKIAGRKRAEFCDVCGSDGKKHKNGICFDHDHETNKFRGWIC